MEGREGKREEGGKEEGREGPRAGGRERREEKGEEGGKDRGKQGTHILPELLQRVEFPSHRGHDIHHHAPIVQQDPPAVRRALPTVPDLQTVLLQHVFFDGACEWGGGREGGRSSSRSRAARGRVGERQGRESRRIQTEGGVVWSTAHQGHTSNGLNLRSAVPGDEDEEGGDGGQARDPEGQDVFALPHIRRRRDGFDHGQRLVLCQGHRFLLDIVA